jgi:hypothetical protein
MSKDPRGLLSRRPTTLSRGTIGRTGRRGNDGIVVAELVSLPHLSLQSIDPRQSLIRHIASERFAGRIYLSPHPLPVEHRHNVLPPLPRLVNRGRGPGERPKFIKVYVQYWSQRRGQTNVLQMVFESR